jgi:hypothetical protein
MPPASHVPPLLMVSRVALLPLPTAKAPERIVPLVSVPNTISDPPLETMVPLPVPPASTNSVPPLETAVTSAVPPEETTCDPVNTVAPLARPYTLVERDVLGREPVAHRRDGGQLYFLGGAVFAVELYPPALA